MLYLLPSDLDITAAHLTIPEYNRQVIKSLKTFIVENERTSRRFIKKANPDCVISELNFITLNKHTSKEELNAMLEYVYKGENIGLLSEAGCPAVADPGANVVQLAHRSGIKVIPLVGPSSIILALMASGFNGQQFNFNGYLPKEPKERIKRLAVLEKLSMQINTTQIFIETPFRNDHLLRDILKHCHPNTMLCIAKEVTGPNESIISDTIGNWKKKNPIMGKVPVVYLLFSGSLKRKAK
ncbi:MAG: SAM-dependent methyltransferase [Flavobacteriales bacterium]|nr:SAM-dependent methyltransferase [Flavobacteriales bacterium]